MKILVTGGAGFIGSNIVNAYLKLGHEIIVIDNLSSGKKVNLNPLAKFYQVDVTSPEMEEIFAKEKPELVSHHAGQIDVRKSVDDPLFDIEVNVKGMVKLLNCSVKYKVAKMIFASTGGALYGEVKEGSAAEDHKLEPISPYAIDKRAAELYLMTYAVNHGLKYTILRYANVYGPRQDPRGEAGVVAIFCNKIMQNAQPFIYGDGNQLRDYVYIDDVVAANKLVINNGNEDLFNIGTIHGTSVNELFGILKEITDFKKDAIYKPARTGELKRSVLNAAKARKVLGWKRKTNLRDGLKKTFEWFNQSKGFRC